MYMLGLTATAIVADLDASQLRYVDALRRAWRLTDAEYRRACFYSALMGMDFLRKFGADDRAWAGQMEIRIVKGSTRPPERNVKSRRMNPSQTGRGLRLSDMNAKPRRSGGRRHGPLGVATALLVLAGAAGLAAARVREFAAAGPGLRARKRDGVG